MLMLNMRTAICCRCPHTPQACLHNAQMPAELTLFLPAINARGAGLHGNCLRRVLVEQRAPAPRS
jgi:hypothetical protein